MAAVAKSQVLDKMNHFADRWVRIQAAQRNMSLIFFAQTFCIVFTLNWVSYDLGAVHKQCGPKRGRRRQFFLVYGITWFIVLGTPALWSASSKNFFGIFGSKAWLWSLKYKSERFLEYEENCDFYCKIHFAFSTWLI